MVDSDNEKDELNVNKNNEDSKIPKESSLEKTKKKE